MGEFFRDRGQDALIIYDDLSKLGKAIARFLAKKALVGGFRRRILFALSC